MKNLALVLALVALSTSALFAQSLTGTWQGTLAVPSTPPRDLRVVIKIAPSDKDALTGMFYSIDQPGPGIGTGAIALQGSAVRMAIPGIGGSYEGKLSADGNSIAGAFTQGPKPLPLNLTRATAETAWVIPEPPAPPKKMRADANPVFEVATIKPTKPDDPKQGLTVQGRRMVTYGTSLSFLIAYAYGVHTKQIAGGPAWLETERYDITAESDEDGQPSQPQLRSMIQKLLADRFKLTFHNEKREISAYVITVGKTGAKLSTSSGDPNGLPGLGFRALGAMIARNSTIADLAGLLQTVVLDRPVVDQTGLTGKYDFTLNWTPEPTQFGGRGGQAPPPADDTAAAPDLFTAIQQQLGLKLESTKTSVPVLVIDKVEKPSEN
jgi:uncharacterized protein (TIGR03435 family)